YDTDDEENPQEFTCQSDMTCDDKGCQLCPRGVLPVGDRGTTLKWRLADTHTQYGILLATLPHFCLHAEDGIRVLRMSRGLDSG
ncbi:hypothetical protein VZ114_23690, partial [Enterobacter hormaechei]|nr:hypothetical protein [Enterobacter hormaechei]